MFNQMNKIHLLLKQKIFVFLCFFSFKPHRSKPTSGLIEYEFYSFLGIFMGMRGPALMSH